MEESQPGGGGVQAKENREEQGAPGTGGGREGGVEWQEWHGYGWMGGGVSMGI